MKVIQSALATILFMCLGAAAQSKTFGLPGQMLQGDGNRWRGRTFGIRERPIC